MSAVGAAPKFLCNARVPGLFLEGDDTDLEGRLVSCEVVDGRFRRILPPDTTPRDGFEVIDLRRRWLLPPFCESHAHFVYGSARERMRTDEKVLHRCLAGEGGEEACGNDRWLLGVASFDEVRLDRLRDHPRAVFVWSIDHHRAYVNGRAGHSLGVDCGVLVESDAFAAWERIPDASGDLRVEADRWLRCGVGAVTTFDRLGSLASLREWAERGDLPIRIAHSVPCEDFLQNGSALQIDSPIGADRFARGRFQVRWVKMFFDGTLGSSTASLFEPYSDATGDRGVNLIDAATRRLALTRIAESGYSVAIHAIGDRAVDDAARFIVELRQLRGAVALDRVEHAELIAPVTLDVLAEHCIPVSVQPCHLLEDCKVAPARWGRERCRQTFPLRSLEARGVPMILGTDSPVESKDPWVNVRAAVDRRGRDAADVWIPEERISLSSALAAYTFRAAEFNGLPPGWGRIASGAPADFQLLDNDAPLDTITDVPSASWSATVLDGDIVAGEWPERRRLA